MMADTPEYTALIVYCDTLVVALKLDPLEVANKLVAKEIIDPEMLEEMLTIKTPNEKSSRLVYKITCKVKEDKNIFYRVVRCLSDIHWTQKASKDLKKYLADFKSLEASKRGYTCNEIQDSLLTIVGMMIVIIAFCYMLLSQFSQAQLKTNALFGREGDQKDLLEKIFRGQHSIINLVGPPGVGKTALAINTAHQLEKLDLCYIYIDVSKHNTTSSLVKALVSNTSCIFQVARLFYLCVNVVDLIPEKLLRTVWRMLLPSNTLLIFDNIEGIWYKQLKLLYEHIIQPLISLRTDLKLLLVSRYYELLFHDNDAVIALSAIKEDDCVAWILHTEQRVNVTEAQKLCQLVGGVPKAVELLLSYALNPMTAESVSDIISAINVSEYGEPFRQYEELLIISDGSYHFIKALYLLYDLLSSEDRTCIWLLVDIQSNNFTISMAEELLKNTNINSSKCLTGLLSHSLLEKEKIESSDKFKFHPIIKEFIRWIGNPVHNEESVRTSVRNFYANYVHYHTTNLCDILNSTNSVQLAVRIGSNRQLINNVLPLLQGNYIKLYRLFKIALKVIKTQCCSVSGNCITTESFANVILSFSYLTKAVHCPDIHPVSLLLNADKRKNQSPNQCLQKLQMCDAVINGMLQAKDRTDYKTAEAIGYYNTLKIWAHPSPPWNLSLLDVAMIVTTANHECHLHYKTRAYLCGEESSIELGLKLLLLQNYARSEKHLTHAFNTHEDDHHCRSILKIITMITLYYCPTKDCSNRAAVKQHLETINYEALNSTCYLGIMNDLILPFLRRIHSDSALINSLIDKHNQMVNIMNNTCQQKTNLDEERLDCDPLNRYTISHGVTALKLFVTEWTENIDDFDEREDWICSIIMDKTDRCENMFPLFSKVRKIETNENSRVIRGLKFFMNDKEFSELEERIRNVSPTFYQLMSI